MYTTKDRIYEKLSTVPEPAGYKGKVPWIVQQQVAATNGIHFVNTIGELQEYPIPEIPIKTAISEKLLLDIGCGWGRWLVAASRKNYIPVGIDLRWEFCDIARKVVSDNGSHAYTVVADLQELPFRDAVFDVVWSFSVIQHTHLSRLVNCLREINRILDSNGYCFLEFPNKKGIRNRFGPAASPNNMDFDSWDVRYYTPEEYREIFMRFFDHFDYIHHSVLGIGILPGDLKYAKGIRNKVVIAVSRLLTHVADIIKPLKEYADSIYIKAEKKTTQNKNEDYVNVFHRKHQLNPGDNLNIVNLLRCPRSGFPVNLSSDGTEVICQKAGLAYPVHQSTPIMVSSEARTL